MRIANVLAVMLALSPMVCVGQGTEECLPELHRDFAEWQRLGEPACWCYPRQCHGDADGLAHGSAKTGFYYVGGADLNLLTAAWQVKEPPHGPGVGSIANGVCADIDHRAAGNAKTGYYRVGQSDLDILIEARVSFSNEGG